MPIDRAGAAVLVVSMCLAPLAGAGTAGPAGPRIAAGVDAGSPPHVKMFDAGGVETQSFFAFDTGFTGGVRVAAGDINGDGVPDIIVGAGPSGSGVAAGPHVKVFSGSNQAVLRDFFAYDTGFTGGVVVASGDVDGDGDLDLILGQASLGSEVRVFDGRSGLMVDAFHPFETGFTGGISVAVGDVDGDGSADVVVGRGPGAPSQVKVFSGRRGNELRDFTPFTGFSGGVYVASGDVDGDGRADIIVGAGSGGTPVVRVFDGATGAELAAFDAYDAGFTGGVRVAAGDVNGDRFIDVITAPGVGAPPQVKVFSGAGFVDRTAKGFVGTPASFLAFSPSFTGGVFVGGAILADVLLSDGFE